MFHAATTSSGGNNHSRSPLALGETTKSGQGLVPPPPPPPRRRLRGGAQVWRKLEKWLIVVVALAPLQRASRWPPPVCRRTKVTGAASGGCQTTKRDVNWPPRLVFRVHVLAEAEDEELACAPQVNLDIKQAQQLTSQPLHYRASSCLISKFFLPSSRRLARSGQSVEGRISLDRNSWAQENPCKERPLVCSGAPSARCCAGPPARSLGLI